LLLRPSRPIVTFGGGFGSAQWAGQSMELKLVAREAATIVQHGLQ
jgi:hypothetical protein